MAIKSDIFDGKHFLDTMRKMQESVHATTRAITEAFDAQAAAVEELTQKTEQLAAEIEKAEKSGNTQGIEEKKQAYNELSQQLEEAKKDFVDMQQAFGRQSGGGAGQAVESAKAKLTQLKNEITALTLEYRTMSEAERNSAAGRELLKKIDETSKKAATLRDAFADANRTINSLASDTKNFDALAGGINLAASAAGAYTGALSMFGAKQEELVEIQTKLQASLAISNALSQIQNNIQKESAVMLGIRDIKEKALATGIAIRTAAEGKGVIATKAATVAQKAFNLVAKANPYVLLATAIVTVVGALYAFSKGSAAAKKKEEELAKATEEAEEKMKNFQETLSGAMMESMAAASTISNLQVAYKNANTEFEKTAILKQAAEQFNKLGLECNGVADAQRILVQQGDAVIEMLQLQGEVAALTALRMEAFKASFNRNIQNVDGEITDDIITLARWEASGNSLVQGLDKQIVNVSAKLSAAKGKLRFRGAGGGGGRSTKKTGGSGGGSNWNQAHATADAQEMLDKYKESMSKLLAEVNQDISDAEVEYMEESTDKVLAQLAEDERKQLNELEEQQKELIKKRRELDISLWEKSGEGRDKYNYQGKSDDEYRAMIEEDTPGLWEALEKRKIQVIEATAKQRRELEKKEAEAEAEQWREYEIQYGNYQQQRLAITEKYNKMIAEATSDAQKAIYSQQMEGELDELDKKIMESSKLWSEYFGKFESRSNSAIRGVMKDILDLIDYMNGVEGAEIPDIFAKNEDALKAIQAAMQDPKAIKVFTDNLKKTWETFKKMIDADNPFKVIANAFKADDNEGMAKGFKQIADAMWQVQGLMSQIGISADSTAGKITSTIGNTASLAAQGAQIGGVYGAAAGAALGIAQGLVGAFGADYSQYQQLVEEYTNLIGVWDELIAKKKEYISESYGIEAAKAGKEAESLVNKEIEAWRRLGRERLNAGASAGSHSIGVRTRQKMTAEDWAGVGYDLGGRLEGLFDLSSEQLERLKENAPTFWAKLDDEVRKYLENIIKGAETLEDIQEQTRNQLTATSFDSVYDSFVSSLSDMDKSAYDFSKDFEKYMFNAVLNAEVGAKFKDRLKAWYNNFAESTKGGLSDDELAMLKAEYDTIVREGVALRDELAKVTGYGSSGEGDATFKSVSSFTQEQGDILNGRLTAIQIGVQSGNLLRQQIVNTVNTLNAIVGGSGVALDDMRDLMAVQNTHLEDIVTLNKKMLSDFGEKMERIAVNTQNL